MDGRLYPYKVKQEMKKVEEEMRTSDRGGGSADGHLHCGIGSRAAKRCNLKPTRSQGG
jgi:hypothetical protein